ncbi:MAG TPA: GntR family transcriptional regulator, partial [Burkholderiaceae bacterium]|nr:GntR family transcriptional regulator [Burkholderiaceae bacterium]
MKTRSSKYVDHAYGHLKDMIKSHRIKPNQQINILQLSEQLHLSVTPIREALNRLLNEGFVVRGAHRGFYSSPIDLKEHAELFDFRVVLLSWGMRLLLEDTPEEKIILLISTWHDTHAKSITTASHKSMFERTLFELILEAVDNRELNRLYTNCMERCGYLWRAFMSSERQYAAFYQRQCDLIEQIEQRNLKAALAIIDRCRQLLINEIMALEKSEHVQLLPLAGARLPTGLPTAQNDHTGGETRLY